MTDNVDILNIDMKIRLHFKEEEDNLQNYINKLHDIKEKLELKNIRSRVKNTLLDTEKKLIEHINDIQNGTMYNFYVTETAFLLEKYKDILNKPLKLNFVGKPMKNNKDKKKIVEEYIEISKKYVDIEIEKEKDKRSPYIENKIDKILCTNCKNKKEFEVVEGNIYICCLCSAQQTVLKNISSYKDIDRINISSKYMYDRKIHFRDCINQYQGETLSCVFFDEICIFLYHVIRSLFFLT